MRISIAMGTYNGARFLRGQLDSLAAQTLLPHELVVCDDDSSDGTAEIVRSFAAKAPFPVRFEQNETRLGYPDNFLKAAFLCTGDAIAFCDQDDVWLPDKLSRVSAELERPGVLCVIHKALVVDDQLKPVDVDWPPIRRNALVSRRFDPWFPAPGFAMTFAREVLTLADVTTRPPSWAGFWSELDRMCHDEWVYVLSCVCGATKLITSPLVLHRQHGANTTGTRRRPRGLGTELVQARNASRDVLAEQYRFFSEVARLASEYLDEQARRHSDPTVSARLAGGAAHYRTIEARWGRRQRLYSVRGGRRLIELAALVAIGGYRARRRGGMGLRRLARDGLTAVGLVGFSPRSAAG